VKGNYAGDLSVGNCILTGTMADEHGTENANGDSLGRGEYTCLVLHGHKQHPDLLLNI
jgi:hypothetical protein